MKRIKLSHTQFCSVISFIWGFSIGIILIRVIG